MDEDIDNDSNEEELSEEELGQIMDAGYANPYEEGEAPPAQDDMPEPDPAPAASDDKPADPAPSDESSGAEAAAAAAADRADGGDGAGGKTTAELAAELEDMKQRLRKNEGHLGRIQQQFKTASTSAQAVGGDLPSDAQARAALGSTEEFKKLQEEFPEFAAALLAEVRNVTAGAAPAQPAQPAIDIEQVTNQAVNAGRNAASEEFVEYHHRGWQDTVRTPRFSTWLEQQPADIKALGASDHAGDAIKMLDEYKKFEDFIGTMGPDGQRLTDAALLETFKQGGVESPKQQKEAERKSREEQNRRRLESSVPATTPRGRTPQPDTSDEVDDAFSEGFKSAR